MTGGSADSDARMAARAAHVLLNGPLAVRHSTLLALASPSHGVGGNNNGISGSNVQGPQLTNELPSRLLFSNSSGGSLPCSATGQPAPTIRWLTEDGDEAADVPRLRHVRQGDGSLVFLPFRADQFRRDVHEARYRCSASNAIGTVVSPQVHVTAAIDLLFSLPDDEREGASVCQLPPVEDGNITDEEHVNENDFSEVVPDDVCGHVEVMQCSDEDVDSPAACSSPDPRQKKPAGRQFTAGKGRKASTNARKTNALKRSHTPVWGDHATFDKTLPSESPPSLLEAFPDLANMSPFMLFSKFISPEYLGSLAELSAKYALEKGEEVNVTGANIGWLLHCEPHKDSDAAMTHIAFRRDVTMSLLQLKQKLTVRFGPRVHPRHEDRKTDGHYIISMTQGRCAECKKNTTNQCQQCKKRLHKKGFATYHSL
ncbi:hypothetical protein HPB51_012885 [Rhipicephalus microplus]|uniref:Ig-like domain-containing protein n=1 Tax=Rhipicephalus microplus TaxID=6941 RepID=A0A9J6DUE7_RHIMP|nr:hypothetical protein HPB51_012885 [Rhipicephalus microplus]